MPPRKNNPADTMERQVAFRERMAEQGLVRRELFLTKQAVEDEAFVRSKMGVERVRELIAWALAKQRTDLEKG